MNNVSVFLVAMLVLVALSGCSGEIKSVSLDYPQGEDRVCVDRNGSIRFYFGALPGRKVKDGVLNIDDVYKTMQPSLSEVKPKELWKDPGATFGMVQIEYENGTTANYLIFDKKTAMGIINQAKNNMD